MKGTSIFADLLSLLYVPHTGRHADADFQAISFKSLFGFSRLLKSYGVDSESLQLPDKTDLHLLPLPFVASTVAGFVIVTAVSADRVDYIYYHKRESLPYREFADRFSGVVLIPHPHPEACEPQLREHRWQEFLEIGKRVALLLCLVLLLTFGFIYSGIGAHLSLIFLFATDIIGLAVCRLLMLKSRRVKNHTADRVCGILQKHGCDTVLEQKASSFLGIVKWSDVGMAYFAVSTLVLLIYPQYAGWLALANGCCLPFTVWSISYQKFKIKAWCTMCVTVQCLLWLQFLCFLFGGWWSSGILPLKVPLLLLIAGYVAATLTISFLTSLGDPEAETPR